VVARGDSIAKISQDEGGPELISSKASKAYDQPGQKFIIPSGQFYRSDLRWTTGVELLNHGEFFRWYKGSIPSPPYMISSIEGHRKGAGPRRQSSIWGKENSSAAALVVLSGASYVLSNQSETA